LVGENKMVLNIGLEETHGEPIGVNLDSSESECINIILPLKTIALGEQLNLQLLGLKSNKKNLKLLKSENDL
jgi:hypothetical protein